MKHYPKMITGLKTARLKNGQIDNLLGPTCQSLGRQIHWFASTACANSAMRSSCGARSCRLHWHRRARATASESMILQHRSCALALFPLASLQQPTAGQFTYIKASSHTCGLPFDMCMVATSDQTPMASSSPELVEMVPQSMFALSAGALNSVLFEP